MEKTKEQLEDEINVMCKLEVERKLSNELYAKIIVQNIVFGTIGIIAIGFLYSLLTKIQWR